MEEEKERAETTATTTAEEEEEEETPEMTSFPTLRRTDESDIIIVTPWCVCACVCVCNFSLFMYLFSRAFLKFFFFFLDFEKCNEENLIDRQHFSGKRLSTKIATSFRYSSLAS
jgi:hypothetical protein